MKIVIGTSDGKPAGFDLETLIVTRLLVQANSGGGKSYLLRKLMEELFRHIQIIAIDPEGEFATLRENFDFVLVGKGGETPAHIGTAEELAHKLLELKVSAICDLYEMPAHERHIWVKKFLDALTNAPKKLWHPLLLILDEAHIFCPEKGESAASDAVVDFVTRGRKRAFCPVLATQRLAKLRKDAAAEMLNVMIGGTFLDVDVDRAIEALSIPTKGKDRSDFIAHIKTVSPGTFVALGRAISKERIELKVGEVQTSHPKPGSSKHAAEPPPPPDKIKGLLPQLADLPKVAEEKAQTIAEFKKEIRELKNQLNAAQRAAPKPAIDQAALKSQIEHAVAQSMALRDKHWMQAIEAYRRNWERALSQQVHLLDGALHTVKFDPPRAIEKVEAKIEVENPDRPPATRAERWGFGAREAAAAENNGELSKSQLRILAALAEFEAIGRTAVSKKWVAALAGASHSSSSFGNNLGALRTAGLINYPAPGAASLTDAGRRSAPSISAPSSPPEMLKRCTEIVSAPQAFILEALAKAYPSELNKEAIAEMVHASPTSSSYGNNLGALRSAGMIEYPSPGTAKLAAWVMLE